MRLLFFTDTHIRGTNPRNRKDNFYETLKTKFNEIRQLCDQLDIDYILHGGDWFDRPDVSPGIVKDFAVILRSFNRPIYTIAGNHDVYGHNPDTVGRTMLGVLEGAGVIHLIGFKDTIFLEKNGIKLQLTGKPYRYDLDGDQFKEYYIVEKTNNADFAINVVHGMLLVHPFFEGIQYTLLEDIKETEADITLAGHYHSGFGIKKVNNKYFANPGSLSRIANTLSEINRKPKVVYIELGDEARIEEIELKSALDGEEVLDRSKLEASQDRVLKLHQFYQEIASTREYKKIDLHEIIEEIAANEDLGKDVKDEAIRRIAIARENLSIADDE
ncbi:MAG: metallophosphoesterase [Clostridia bacterium]|nr:metallophosphoesterase [Clostridia bacterium]